MKPANSCSVCAESLVRPNSESSKERERLIEIKSLGGLLRQSDLVYAIIIQVSKPETNKRKVNSVTILLHSSSS